jgi:hypothetical protein
VDVREVRVTIEVDVDYCLIAAERTGQLSVLAEGSA